MKSDIKPLRLLVKTLLLFIIVNGVFAVMDPPLYKITAYNTIFPGRVRLPFVNDEETYNVMVDNLDFMVASHEISAPKEPDEYRVAILGDSSIWGQAANAQESISVLWNNSGDSCGNKNFKFYNLAYPHPSIVKDLIILDKAKEYDPDMIVWFLTLNTLNPRQISPFIWANADRATKVLDKYGIDHSLTDIPASSASSKFFEKTLVGRRSELLRVIKLQTLGLVWAISGADTPARTSTPVPLSMDVTNDSSYKAYQSESELKDALMLNALTAGHDIAGSTPILIVNEPIFIATGMNSDVRYNHVYPRWAYDYYREVMQSAAQRNQWHYLDLWDAIPQNYFFDTGFYVFPAGQKLMLQKIDPVIQSIACR